MTHAIRDAAWKVYYLKHCANWTPRDETAAKNAFIAGWTAYSEAQHIAHAHPACPAHDPSDAAPRLCQHWHVGHKDGLVEAAKTQIALRKFDGHDDPPVGH